MGTLMKVSLLIVTVALTVTGAAPIESQAPQRLGEVLGNNLTAIITDETTTYVNDFQSMTNLKAEVSPAFTPDIARRVVSIQAQPGAPPAAIEATFRTRFRYFLSNMTAYLLGIKQGLVFTPDNTARYLAAAAKVNHCGEYPCESGCAPGKPCDDRCNVCKPGRGGLMR